MALSVALSAADSVIWLGTTIAPQSPFRWYATNVPLPSPSQYMLLSGLPLGCPVLPPLLSPSPPGPNKWSMQVFATLVTASSWLSSSFERARWIAR